MLVYNPINYTSIYHKPELIQPLMFFRQLSWTLSTWGAPSSTRDAMDGPMGPLDVWRSDLPPGLMHAKGFDFETNDPVPKVPIEHHH